MSIEEEEFYREECRREEARCPEEEAFHEGIAHASSERRALRKRIAELERENEKLHFVREDMEHGGVNCIAAIEERDQLREDARALAEALRESVSNQSVLSSVLTAVPPPPDGFGLLLARPSVQALLEEDDAD